MGEQGFDQAVSRLAQYRPFSNEGANLRAALRDLVLAAGAEAGTGGVFETLDAVQDAFRALWRLEVEVDELDAARDLLVAEGKARTFEEGFALTADALSDLEAVRAESEETRAMAFGEWAEHVRRMRPELTDAEFASLVRDLEAWLGKVISRHGVEAALVLYPENPRAQTVFQRIEDVGFSFLPPCDPVLESIRGPALQAFVKQPTFAQRTYLADRLNTSYFLTVLSLDPAASQLMQERIEGQRVYLDTNVLYAVLGLSKPQEALSALRLLDLTRELGYEVAITPWTVQELRASLDRARRGVQQKLLPRRDLAPIFAVNSKDPVEAAFWSAYRDRGTLPHDFFDFYGHFETLLKGHRVKVEEEGIEAVEQDRETIEAQMTLLALQLDEPEKAFDVVLEHDAKHRLLIERLRGSNDLRFTNARCWFLTRDGKLPPYALSTTDETTVQLPFCVATSSWLQVMRSFVPRTEDLDETVVDLLASPYIQMSRGLRPEIVDEVVGRVDQYAETNAQLASEVLADTALVADIEQATDSDDRRRRVDRALEQKTAELEQILTGSGDVSDERIAAVAARRDADAQTDLERRQLHLLETEFKGERRARIDAERELKKLLERLNGDLTRFKRQLVRTFAAGTLAVCAVAIAAALLATKTVRAPGLAVAVVTLAITAVLYALRLTLGARRGDVVATWVAIAVTIAGFVWFAREELTDKPPGGTAAHQPAR